MSTYVKLKKGFDIRLAGAAQKKVGELERANTYVIKPTDFYGIGRQKLYVQEGDTVKAGTPLFSSRLHEGIMFTAPVSGEVVEVKRGEKRKLLEVKILADRQMQYEPFPAHSVSDIHNLGREQIVEILLRSGCWPYLIQRPFAVMADPNTTPQAIFISAFDTSPLAPDYDFLYKGDESAFQTGINILKKLTPGSVHLNLNAEAEISALFSQVQGVKINKFSGPHPAGNVGVQIHHISPISKSDLYWTISPMGIIQIGRLFMTGEYDTSRLLAVVGSEAAEPQYYRIYQGTCVDKIAQHKTKGNALIRFVSGNVLTGERIEPDGHLGFYHQQLTILPEGKTHDFLGWIKPTSKKLSFQRSFGLLSFLNPKEKEYVLDTNTNGEERPFVQSGIMEQVLPMDILPVYLLKAIMAQDFDAMEALGIYEVAEEDLALCEFVDVSKIDVQQIVREGIELMQNG